VFLSVIGLATVAGQLRGIRRLLDLAGGPGRSLGLRFGYWEGTVDALHPGMIVFGEGLGSWPVLVHPGADVQYYPHNMFLEVLFELGVIGVVLLGAVLGYAAVNLYRDWRAHGGASHAILAVLFIYMMANVMVSGDLNENRYLFAIVGTMAYTVGAQPSVIGENFKTVLRTDSPAPNT
jgi:hypothetical protein